MHFVLFFLAEPQAWLWNVHKGEIILQRQEPCPGPSVGPRCSWTALAVPVLLVGCCRHNCLLKSIFHSRWGQRANEKSESQLNCWLVSIPRHFLGAGED